ncbi:uncharacterized protein LOC106672115 isoform X2 [Cimex lectularius]|nr:uncharacterized protein LOC106672115 isoform X2 [Cimex lectularius]
MFLWSQVASEVGVDVETARYKWRGLRDTFRVQLRKLNQPQAKRPKSQLPQKWEYFDEMNFVKEQIYIDVNRKKYYDKEKMSEIKDDEDESKDEGEEDFEETEKSDEAAEDYQGLADFCITEVREDTGCLEFDYNDERNSDVSEEELTLLNKPHMNYLLQRKLRSLQDDNYCFLMSVLPQLKSLPNKEKLYIRIKIQEMLLAEILNLENQK